MEGASQREGGRQTNSAVFNPPQNDQREQQSVSRLLKIPQIAGTAEPISPLFPFLPASSV